MNQTYNVKELYDLLHMCTISEMPPRTPETLLQMIKTAELDKEGFYTNMPNAISMNEEGTSYLIKNLMDGYIMGPDLVDGNTTINILAFSIFFTNVHTIPLDLWFPVWLPNKLNFSSEPLVTQVPIMKTEDGVTKILITDSAQFLDSKLVDVKPQNDRIIMDLYTYKFLQGIKDYYMIVPVSRQHSVSGMRVDNFPIEDQTKRWILLDILHRHIRSSIDDKQVFLKKEIIKKKLENAIKVGHEIAESFNENTRMNGITGDHGFAEAFNEINRINRVNGPTETPMDYQMTKQEDRIIIEEID